MWTLGPRLMYIAVFIPAALSGVPLCPERLYVGLALLHVVTHTVLGCVFLAISRASETFTTLNRIQVRSTLLENLGEFYRRFNKNR